MSRSPLPLKNYKNEQLMDEFNDLCIRVKVWLFDVEKLKKHYPKPNNQEIDVIFHRITKILKQDCELMKKF